jgi:hypothetical protein
MRAQVLARFFVLIPPAHYILEAKPGTIRMPIRNRPPLHKETNAWILLVHIRAEDPPFMGTLHWHAMQDRDTGRCPSAKSINVYFPH